MYTEAEDIFWEKERVGVKKKNGAQGEERAKEKRERQRQTEKGRRGDVQIEAIRREKIFLRYGCFLMFLKYSFLLKYVYHTPVFNR